jgi:hypothetical protein
MQRPRPTWSALEGDAMKSLLISAAVGLAITACGCTTARADEPKAEAQQTLQGELVDLACYLGHGGKGEKHKACATSCAKSGLPIGLLDKDNTLTLVIGDHKPMNAELADKMGTTVKLTGEVSSRNGMKIIEVSKVQ